MKNRNPASYSLLACMRRVFATRYGRPLLQWTAGLGALSPLLALANPTGGQVVGGQATISTPSGNATVVKQTSQNAAINWQQFSVGSGQYVQFVQPDSSAVILNRVIGGNPSSIFGDITANGQVFLVNPSGILFAPGASLDVGGLVASTQDINPADFMAGRYSFTKASGAPDATVVNQGSIVANGGYVVLAGDYVENDGVINAQSGRVLLAAGGGTTLTLSGSELISYTVNAATLARLAGVDNTGEIEADGGTVVMTGDVANALTATAVNNSGFVAAHSITSRDGVILLLAEGGDIENSGTLDASATDAGVAGGTILVRSNQKTELDPTSVITTAGDGAKGGFIDLSGHQLSVRGLVKPGAGGTLMYDPSTLKIVSGAASGANASIGTAYITSQMSNNVDLELVASNIIENISGVRIKNTNGTTGVLQLRTGNLTSNGGTFLGGAHCFTGGVCVVGPGSNLFTAGTGTINLTGLSIDIKGEFMANASHGAVTLGAVSANNGIFVTGGTIQVNGNLTAANGILSLDANHGGSGVGFIRTAPGVKLEAPDVQLSVGGSYGGVISVGTISGGTVGVTLDYRETFSSSPEKIVTGNLSGKNIRVSAIGPKSSIVINGNINAVNASNRATLNILSSNNGGSGVIQVNGNITVSGKAGASPEFSFYDLPMAAQLKIAAGGSGNGVHQVKVNGKVDVTAVAGSYFRTSDGYGAPLQLKSQTGTGGLATVVITAAGSHGLASVIGSMDVKGPDAVVSVQAKNVAVGNVNVTGSGHHVTRSLTAKSSAGISYQSSNSAGQARLDLGSTAAVSATVKAGNITVSGKGVAGAELLASNVTVGNVSVTATAAKGSVKQRGNGNVSSGSIRTCAGSNCNSSVFYRGIGVAPLHSGSIDAGRANLLIAAGTGAGSGSNGVAAVSVNAGTLSVTGVGQARLVMLGKAIQTQALSAVATRGTEKGTGSSQSGGTSAPSTYKHSFDINGGQAGIKLRSGNSGSHSSGVLVQNGGPVAVNGDVTVSGPAADLDIKGKTVKIGGAVTVTGSGGSLTSDTVFSAPSSPGFHTHITGGVPTTLNIEGGASGSVSVAGKTTIKGPGLVGAIVVAGNVTLHGVSASASAAVSQSVLDTRVSTTTTTFTGASAGLVIADVTVAGGKPVFTSASDVGDFTVNSKGDVDLPAMIKVSGKLDVTATGDVLGSVGSLVKRIDAVQNNQPHAGSSSGHGGPSSAGLPHFSAKAGNVTMKADNITLTGATLTAGSVDMVAAGSINLSGMTLTASKTTQLVADKDIILSGVNINTGTLIATASGTIHNGGAQGSITANALALEAKKDITLTSTQVNIGAGSVSSVHGDALLLEGLAGLGIAPTANAPNGAFIAGGALSLGGLKLTGSYLLLQAKSVSILGPVSVPKGALVQVVPFDDTTAINFENKPTTAAGFDLANLGFVNLFGSGVTFAFGDSTESGAVNIGTNGPIDIGSDNLVIVSTGDVTGLSTVTSTGLVASLYSVLGPPVPPVTAGEIDPTAGSTGNGLGDQTNKRQLGANGVEGGQDQGGTINQDTGTASVCH